MANDLVEWDNIRDELLWTKRVTEDDDTNFYGRLLEHIDSLTVEAETYRQMHETAKEMGYPSILEALEAVDSLTVRIAQLEAALRLCVPIIEEEREVCFYSHKEADGKVRDRNALYELRKYDKALKASRAALKDGGE